MSRGYKYFHANHTLRLGQRARVVELIEGGSTLRAAAAP